MKKLIVAPLLALSLSCGGETAVQEMPWSQRAADSFLARYPEAIPYNAGNPELRWNYEPGLMYVALLRMWEATGDRKYLDAVQKNLDLFLEEDGTIRTYRLGDFNLDMVLPGRALLYLYRESKQHKYRAAADTLRLQLREQPRTPSGGFWHKKIYPNQMWLDGIYMAQPFYAEYAANFGEPPDFDDIAHQITLIEQKTRDAKTGLLYHGWDESRQQRWANPETGCSPNFWGRAIGWYAMGLVDVLEYFPLEHPKRDSVVSILQRLAAALKAYQDPTSGLWYQVVDVPEHEGNYRETSASAMFAYAFAKGVRLGHLDRGYLALAGKAFDGLVKEMAEIDDEGMVSLREICSVGGLGGTPYRDGGVEYYLSEPRRVNDFKGVGPFILAALELGR